MASNSQSVNITNSKTGNVNIDQSMGLSSDLPKPSSKDEFVTAINKLVAELQKVSSEHPDIEDAIAELKAAIQETKKAKPEPSAIKRFLNTAKGALVDVAETVTAIGTVTATITMLIGTLRVIFGL